MKKVNTVFVLGYPRSGTTWFANLFNSHPDVAYRHEVIGRCYRLFPEKLFASLKYNNGLTDAEHESAIDIVMSPNVDSDRAPFFPKNHLRFGNTRFHYFSWLATKTVGFLQPLYKKLYYPAGDKLSLVIKETRSTVNMDSMLIGLRADSVVVLFRHPCGAIASFLKGIAKGVMGPTNAEERSFWFKENREKAYLASLNLTEEEVVALPEHKYLAILWAQQNEDYLAFESDSYNRFFVSYEDFMSDKETKVKKLFNDLSLGFDAMVEEFLLSTSSASGSAKPSLKDSSNPYYSVYRDEKFDPHKWMKDLTAEEIADIAALTADTYSKLIDKSDALPDYPVTSEASIATDAGAPGDSGSVVERRAIKGSTSNGRLGGGTGVLVAGPS